MEGGSGLTCNKKMKRMKAKEREAEKKDKKVLER